ncbi:MAG: hypothetical protein ABI395_10065 [Sphingobium sp.]
MHALKYRHDEAYIPRALPVRPVDDAGEWDASGVAGESPAHLLQRELITRLGGVAATLENPEKYDTRVRLAIIVGGCGMFWAAVVGSLYAIL